MDAERAHRDPRSHCHRRPERQTNRELPHPSGQQVRLNRPTHVANLRTRRCPAGGLRRRRRQSRKSTLQRLGGARGGVGVRAKVGGREWDVWVGHEVRVRVWAAVRASVWSWLACGSPCSLAHASLEDDDVCITRRSGWRRARGRRRGGELCSASDLTLRVASIAI